MIHILPSIPSLPVVGAVVIRHDPPGQKTGGGAGGNGDGGFCPSVSRIRPRFREKNAFPTGYNKQYRIYMHTHIVYHIGKRTRVRNCKLTRVLFRQTPWNNWRFVLAVFNMHVHVKLIVGSSRNSCVWARVCRTMSSVYTTVVHGVLMFRAILPPKIEKPKCVDYPPKKDCPGKSCTDCCPYVYTFFVFRDNTWSRSLGLKGGPCLSSFCSYRLQRCTTSVQ